MKRDDGRKRSTELKKKVYICLLNLDYDIRETKKNAHTQRKLKVLRECKPPPKPNFQYLAETEWHIHRREIRQGKG